MEVYNLNSMPTILISILQRLRRSPSRILPSLGFTILAVRCPPISSPNSSDAPSRQPRTHCDPAPKGEAAPKDPRLWTVAGENQLKSLVQGRRGYMNSRYCPHSANVQRLMRERRKGQIESRIPGFGDGGTDPLFLQSGQDDRDVLIKCSTLQQPRTPLTPDARRALQDAELALRLQARQQGAQDSLCDGGGQ